MISDMILSCIICSILAADLVSYSRIADNEKFSAALHRY